MDKNTFNLLVKKINTLPVIEGFNFEILNSSHTKDIVAWRNNRENNKLFFSREKYTVKKQELFLEKYEEYDRFDIVLKDKVNNITVGVFSIKNISGKPEIGKLMGNTDYRGRGLSKKVTGILIKYFFENSIHENVIAYTQVKNIINININLKLGFRIIDIMKIANDDYYLMELNKKDFRFNYE